MPVVHTQRTGYVPEKTVELLAEFGDASPLHPHELTSTKQMKEAQRGRGMFLPAGASGDREA
jgi:hypothetical protein